MTLLDKLATLHKETEINFQLSSFWDMGYTAKIGDSVNGYEQSKNFEDLNSAVLWLISEMEKD